MSQHKNIQVSQEQLDRMFEIAMQQQKVAYARYSNFHVGAALLADDDKIYPGCNVENISYGLTVCAERTASFTMASNGTHGIKAVVVSTINGTSPCGACRQVLAEFAVSPQVPVYLIAYDHKTQQPTKENAKLVLTTSMGELLPHSCQVVFD